MRTYFTFFLKSTVYWIIIFFLFRLAFLLQLSPWNDGIDNSQSLQTFVHGFRLDLSAIFYILLIPLLIKSTELFIRKKWFLPAINIYHGIILGIVVLVCSGNMVVYEHWGTMINNRAISFLTDPTEVFASATYRLIILGSVALIASYVLLLLLYIKIINPRTSTDRIPVRSKYVSLFIALVIFVIGMRGGLQQIPINESAAYFSKHRAINHIATNSFWHLISNLKQSSLSSENPYVFMEQAKASKIVDGLFADRTVRNFETFIDTSATPNIILVMLEGWTADVIDYLRGYSDVTPQFNNIARNSLLFTNMYSSGFRTDQALTSLLSGYPAQPNKSIIRFPSKTPKLPSLFKELQNTGYNTSFYYGGELGFANMRSYLLSQNINNIISKESFEDKYLNNKWGAEDEVVFDKLQTDLDNMKSPFFTTILTLSSHEPFDVPMETPFKNNDDSDKYKKAVYYTDYCLGKFMNVISKKEWYKNTLVLIVADHGHTLPLKRNFYDPGTRRIPFIITGGALKNEWRGKRISNISNQHDIPSTLLTQLGMDASEFKWSNNLMDTLRYNFAYISQDNAFTFIEEAGIRSKILQFVNMKDLSKIEHLDDTSKTAVTADAYLQMLFNDFLQY
jgi:phosphoglycerol transferase MdoB-like AlkP superfamily enzyme